MFKIAAKTTVTWPVTVNIPQDGGGTTKATMSVQFEKLSTSRMEELTNEREDLLKHAVVGWNEGAVQDEQGQPLAYSDEAKARLLEIPYVRTALFEALAQINQGRAAAKKT